MTTRRRSTLPWPNRRETIDPFADFDANRLMVFVPAIMSVGIVFSFATLLRDAFQRTGRRLRERRISLAIAATVDEVLGTTRSEEKSLGLLARSSYLIAAAAAGSTAVTLAVVATSSFSDASGRMRDIGTVLALALVATMLLTVVSGAAWSLWRSFPHPSPWALSTLRAVPLSVNPSRRSPGPSRRLTEGVFATALATGLLTVLVALDLSFIQSIDDAILDRFARADWIDHLGVVDAFGSTAISIGFVALIGLSAFRCRVIAIVYPATFVTSWVITFVLQETVERPRPLAVTNTQAFPSGHMVQAVFIAGLLPTAVAVLFKARGRAVVPLRVILGGLVIATGALRLHHQDHWPVDALTGALLGLFVVFGTYWILAHRGWHERCGSCPWSPHPEALPWRRGLFDLDIALARRIGWIGAVGAVCAAGALAVATSVLGLPMNPEGDGLGAAVLEPAQLALASIMGLAGLLALRWKAPAAFLMALCATGLGLLASVEYPPVLTFVLAMALLIPAILTWLSWQPHATRGTIAALAVVTVTSLTTTAIGSTQIYGHYFGPTHPSSVALALNSDADWLWLGAVGPREATVVAGGLESGDDAALTLWSGDQTVMTLETFADEDGIARFELAELDPATRYSYSVRLLESVSISQADPQTPDARLTTFAEGAQDLDVVIASCARNESNGAVFDAMLEEDPDLYLAIGDLHYANLESTDPDDHLRQLSRSLSQPGQAALFSSIPTGYVWDDHDFGANDGNSTSVSRTAVSTAYRQAVPHYDVDPDPDQSIAQAFSIGRVRFIMTDNRSQRTQSTMLGEQQLEWLVDELVTASQTHALVVWANPSPWISEVGIDADDWSAFPEERRAIADALVNANVENLVMVSGDAHMVAVDDGTNSGYAGNGAPGFPVLHAAALDRPGSIKGGPYSHGAFAGGGQYGRLEIADDGASSIDVRLSGHNWMGEELVRYDFTVDVP